MSGPEQPAGPLMVDQLRYMAQVLAAEPGYVDLDTKQTLTFRQWDEQSNQIAHWLVDNGVRKGDRVSIALPNDYCLRWIVAYAGVHKAGAVMVPANTRLSSNEMTAILSHAEISVMFTCDGLLDHARAVRAQVPSLRAVVSADGPSDGVLGWDDELAGVDASEIQVAVEADDMADIMYTSGTTGLPKGAIITHGMTFWNCVNLGGPAYISPSSVLLTVLPLFHTGGLNCYTNPVLHAGGTVKIMRAFDPGLALQLISDPSHRINTFFGVPSIYQFMAQHPAFAGSDFSRLVIGGVGGAPMPVPLLKVWEERGVALQQGYGMTETSPAVLTLDREDAVRKAGSSGKPVLHTEVRIVRPDGADADIGELGELWVKGPNITPGYWNRPDANQSSFTDGWLHTGDAARIDQEGFYYIVDRWKDMYISGGENVYPAEVENVLHQLAAIAEAAVIGIADAQWGEVGMAIVAVKPGHALTEAEIQAHCEANLARFKRPYVIRFVEALPRNATGKIHKPTLRKNFGIPTATDSANAGVP